MSGVDGVGCVVGVVGVVGFFGVFVVGDGVVDIVVGGGGGGNVIGGWDTDPPIVRSGDTQGSCIGVASSVITCGGGSFFEGSSLQMQRAFVAPRWSRPQPHQSHCLVAAGLHLLCTLGDFSNITINSHGSWAGRVPLGIGRFRMIGESTKADLRLLLLLLLLCSLILSCCGEVAGAIVGPATAVDEVDISSDITGLVPLDIGRFRVAAELTFGDAFSSFAVVVVAWPVEAC